MTPGLAPVFAQVGAEVKMRLRSFATLAALLAFLAAAFLWLPDPAGRGASLAWHTEDGRHVAPLYTSGYVGLAITLLGSTLLTLFGFYLVAGSVRRDRQSGVGAILAATPLSKSAYLCGKFFAHAAYFFVVAALALPAGLVTFARWGQGSFRPGDYLFIFVLTLVPALLFTAAVSVLFDATPGLSGRGGLVAWFFLFLLVVIGLPMWGVEAGSPNGLTKLPLFDPAGVATLEVLIRQSVPDGKNFSSGLIIEDKPFERVPWNGIPIHTAFVASRAAQLLDVVPPLFLAVLLFDRFDPARSRRRAAREGLFSRIARRFAGPGGEDPSAGADTPALSLPPASPRPTALAAVVAEARLIWDTGSLLKWPFAVAALLAAVLPSEGIRMGAAAFLLLAIPLVSEVAAREEISGTRALVFSQPGVPASPLLWKAASCALFLLLFGLPAALRLAASSLVRGLAFVAGLLFLALAAAALGALTSGGKLFSAVFLVLWYVALSGLPAADFTGALSKAPAPIVSFLSLAAGLALYAAARARELLARA
jgi:hypothetical protein